MADYNSAYTGVQIDANLALAATAVQDADLATVATTGAYADLTGKPSLATVATSGAYGDLSGKPTLGTAAATASTDYATAAQGTLADSATQPGDDAADLGSGSATDGYVLTADGAGGAAWEAASGGGGSSVTDYLRTRLGTVQDVFNMADTWNASGTTFTGIKLNVTDTASAAGSLLMDLQVGGVSRFSVGNGAGAIFATNLIEQRNGVNAQAFNLYNTYTNASNYERGVMKWASNVLTIGAEKLGTGATRHIKIGPDGLSGVGLAGGNATTTHAVACGDSSATAVYAFAAIGGAASGAFSAAIGRAVNASGNASVAMGYFTNAYQANQYALGFSTFDISTGTVVNQTSTFVLNASTTNATATEMGTGYGTFSRMVVRASTTWAFEITVAARSDGGVDNATYMYRGMIKRDASNNTVLVGTVDNFYTNETDAAWDVAVTADDTTESLKVMVTGAAATNINWTAKVILTEVGNV